MADGPCARNQRKSRAGGRQLVGVGLGRLLTVQQRVGDLIDPVVVPARDISARMQHGAVITAQRRAVDDDHLHPIQPTQGAGIEDQLSVVGEPAAEHRGEGLTAHVRGLRYPGQHRAGGVFGATTGNQRAGGRDQRTVSRLVDVVLDRPGHRSLRGVDGGVDGSVDDDVGSLARGGGRPVMPRGLRTWGRPTR